MPMNPVLEYAVAHQSEACRLLLSRGVPLDDVDDVVHDALVRVCQANPKNLNPRSYWLSALHSARCDYWCRRHRQPLSFSYGDGVGELVRDREDPRQDTERQFEVSEALRQVEDICRTATPEERDAIAAKIAGEPMGNARNQRLFRLRRRLRAAVANPL